MKDPVAAREAMIKGQVIINGVYRESVIDAMAEIPKEQYTPKEFFPVAYSALEIPLYDGRFMIEPMILARLLDAAQIDDKSVVLNLACGTGYTASICALIARHVVAVENSARCLELLKKNIADLKLSNITVLEMSPEKGAVDMAPYDIVFIDGAIEKTEPEIINQLKTGGRLVTVIKHGLVGKAVCFTKNATGLKMDVLFECVCSAVPEFILQ